MTLIDVVKMRNAVWQKRGYRLGSFGFVFVRRFALI